MSPSPRSGSGAGGGTLPLPSSIWHLARSTVLPFVGWRGVEWAQRVRHPALDLWFAHFPFLGNEMQYVLLMPWLSWYADAFAGHAVRLFLLFSFIVFFLNNAIKDKLQLPRPPKKYLVTTDDGHGIVAQQAGFPSTHAAVALTHAALLYSYLSGSSGSSGSTGDSSRGIVAAFAPLAAGGIVAAYAPLAAGAGHLVHTLYSRLYLGMHSYMDLTGGCIVGILVVWCLTLNPFASSENSGQMAFAALDEYSIGSNFGQIVVASAVVAALVFLYPDRRPDNSA